MATSPLEEMADAMLGLADAWLADETDTDYVDVLDVPGLTTSLDALRDAELDDDTEADTSAWEAIWPEAIERA